MMIFPFVSFLLYSSSSSFSLFYSLFLYLRGGSDCAFKRERADEAVNTRVSIEFQGLRDFAMKDIRGLNVN